MTGTCHACQSGAYFSITASTPGFCSPIEFSMPPGVSVTRGVGLPMRGFSVVPLQQIAPEPLDVDDVAVLDAVPERARGHEDRIGEHEPAIRHESTRTGRPRATAAGAGLHRIEPDRLEIRARAPVDDRPRRQGGTAERGRREPAVRSRPWIDSTGRRPP